jgi:hypothetical protein
MHAETVALLHSKHEVLSWLHDIIRIVLKLKNPPKISLLITNDQFPKHTYTIGMLLYVIKASI